MSYGGPGGSNARQQVSGPAIGLLVVGIINVLGALYFIFNGIVSGAAASNPGMVETKSAEEAAFVAKVMAVGGVTYVIVGILALAAAGLTIFASLKMKNLESRNLALFGSIAAMIPCVSPCCLAGLPLGIWALVVISKPEVKSAFTS